MLTQLTILDRDRVAVETDLADEMKGATASNDTPPNLTTLQWDKQIGVKSWLKAWEGRGIPFSLVLASSKANPDKEYIDQRYRSNGDPERTRYEDSDRLINVEDIHYLVTSPMLTDHEKLAQLYDKTVPIMEKTRFPPWDNQAENSAIYRTQKLIGGRNE